MESQNSVHIATRHIGIERGYAVLAKEMIEHVIPEIVKAMRECAVRGRELLED